MEDQGELLECGSLVLVFGYVITPYKGTRSGSHRKGREARCRGSRDPCHRDLLSNKKW